MKKILFFCTQIFLLISVHAEMYTHQYTIGKTSFTETNESLKIQLSNSPPIHVDVQPNGFWPPVHVDALGLIYVGEKIIDSTSGNVISTKNQDGDVVLNFPHEISVIPKKNGFLFKNRLNQCYLSNRILRIDGKKSNFELLKDKNFRITTSDKQILALQMNFNNNGESSYVLHEINVNQCRIVFEKNIGNPDLLVELGWTKNGGWWLTGSIESTLLRSEDGRRWRKVKLPNSLSSLISSYVVNEKEIWLAAVLASGLDSEPYEIIYSDNAGKTWSGKRQDDVLLKKMPPYWLEGKSRMAEMEAVLK